MQVPGLRWLLDAYQLWMAGRGALVGFALVGSRPPLHVAVPFQLLGLWRVHAADFCRANILQHPTMRRRTGKSTCGRGKRCRTWCRHTVRSCEASLLIATRAKANVLPCQPTPPAPQTLRTRCCRCFRTRWATQPPPW